MPQRIGAAAQECALKNVPSAGECIACAGDVQIGAAKTSCPLGPNQIPRSGQPGVNLNRAIDSCGGIHIDRRVCAYIDLTLENDRSVITVIQLATVQDQSAIDVGPGVWMFESQLTNSSNSAVLENA